MKNTKRLLLSLIIVILFGLFIYTFKNKNSNITRINDQISTSTNSVVYTDSKLGFNFYLPETWKGYSILNNRWEGSPLKSSITKQTGDKIIIRNPKWTDKLPYEDIPIMVFSLKQWDSYIAEDFAVSAAPVAAAEIGRNDVYVFALPPRWNFDSSEGYIEALNIVQSKPLKTFNLLKK